MIAYKYTIMVMMWVIDGVWFGTGATVENGERLADGGIAI